jgi:hypothetical protein
MGKGRLGMEVARPGKFRMQFVKHQRKLGAE